MKELSVKQQNARIYEACPIGIIITMGVEVIEANGGLGRFIRHLESCCRDENSGHWLHKSRNPPKQDIAQVYICILNQIRYRAFYGGYERGETAVYMLDGERRKIVWPRILLGGPMEKAPDKITMRGFQGFRYIYEPLW